MNLVRIARVRQFLLGLGALTLLSGCGGADRGGRAGAPAPDSSLTGLPPLEQAVRATNAFAFDLFHEEIARRGADASFVIAPYEAARTAALLGAGAAGDTRDELAGVLRMPPLLGRVHDGFGALSAALANRPDNPLQESLALWTRSGLTLQPEFLETARRNYHLEPAELDLRSSEAVTRAVQAWAGTGGLPAGRIPGNLSGGHDLAATAVARTQGHWLRPFILRQTKPYPFYIDADNLIEIPMMRTVDAYRATPLATGNLVELAYVGDEAATLLLVPHQIDGLAELIRTVTPDSIDAWVRRLSIHHVDLSVPKVRLEGDLELDDALRRLGARRTFGGEAELTRISSDTPRIGPMAVMASLDLAEFGSEVTDLTDASEPRLRATKSGLYMRVHANRPFLVLTRESSTGAIFLIGQVGSPPVAR